MTKKWPINDSARRKALEMIEQWIREEEEKCSNNVDTKDPKQDETK
ncbi:hypothetical protein [Paenibacillus wynnii]|nr:hypothetical protein [Paenibacillus wynnii]MDQ0194920.1 hypothetical protein [Paenibacillus wynnii]